MKWARLPFLLLAISVSISGSAQSHILTFLKQIGVGRSLDKSGWMSFVAFSPDGTMVAADGATTSTDVSNDLSLWSFPEGKLLKRLPYHVLGISPDWKYYVTDVGVREFTTDKTVIAGKNIDFYFPRGRYVAEVSQHRHGRGSNIRVIDLSSTTQVSAFGRRNPLSLAISPDGTTLAAGYWNVVTLWNLRTGVRVAVLEGFGRYVEGLAFSKDGKLLAGGTDLGELQIWDVDHRVRLHSVQIDGGYVSDPAFSPDGRFVAVGVYGTGAVWLIDIKSGKIIDHQRVSDMGCGAVAFSTDGRFLITPSTGGLIRWPYDRAGTIRVFKVVEPK